MTIGCPMIQAHISDVIHFFTGQTRRKLNQRLVEHIIELLLNSSQDEGQALGRQLLKLDTFAQQKRNIRKNIDAVKCHIRPKLESYVPIIETSARGGAAARPKGQSGQIKRARKTKREDRAVGKIKGSAKIGKNRGPSKRARKQQHARKEAA